MLMMSVKAGKIVGKQSLRTRIDIWSIPDDLLDGIDKTVLSTSVLGTGLKLNCSLTGSVFNAIGV